ncbi:hypothetical protein OZX57_00600 [Bifidobacterium sp. ESL0682]|uniref:hypothetical protein n=1 Tax=Bifidobacterium sp. ESL0682 TaxID=2983212 RepID=UPI0023F911AC|nr:hypothetical protein [Bifidobacterium sp. ESL0682]WEV42051.1 hypothetical protein OZX57_00600 [Bifidobacterium sp. ESL0682]
MGATPDNEGSNELLTDVTLHDSSGPSTSAFGKVASSAADAVVSSATKAAEGVSDVSRNLVNHASRHLTLIGRVYGVLVLLVGLVGVPYVRRLCDFRWCS